MSQQYFDGDDTPSSSQGQDPDPSFPPSNPPLRPSYMTVGQGSTSASAAALVSALDHDSGYGGSISDGYSNDGSKRWNPAITEDRYTPADTPGAHDGESENKKALASHVHQLYYNQNRAALGRQITRAMDTLKRLQQMNTSWPVHYPSIGDKEDARPGSRHGLPRTQTSASSTDLHAKSDNAPLRPHAPKRAQTSLSQDVAAESSSSAEKKESSEPDRLITPQLAQEFSVLKLNLNVQGLTQAEITHSIEKKSLASLLDNKINQITRHLINLRERIEDTSSKVLITGDLNAGKSTFCNSLLRRKILPEDQQPCTSIFCEVLDAKENANIEEVHAIPKKATYNRNDESTYHVYQLYELEKIVTDNERYTSCKVYVKDIRSIDESLLNNGVVDIALIDAPGLNSDSLKTTAVFARQEEIDVVVFVVSAANHFTLSAKEFIWNAANEKAYIFMVVNGFDNIRDKPRCERMILEQVAKMSPRTFKESSELVHFVSSNAIPTAPAPGPPDGDDSGPGGGGGSSSGPANDFPKPEDDEEESLEKHGEPGSPPDKGKGKDKEKIRDFGELESSLRRFVLEKRARSKLAPAKHFLLGLMTDLNFLATTNRDVAQAELDRVSNELAEIEPAFEKSTQARTEVTDQLENLIEDNCSDIYKDTRTVIRNAITNAAEGDLGVPYPGFTSAFQYAEDLKNAMLDSVASAIGLSEEKARYRAATGVNTVKSLGLLHLGNKFPSDLTLNGERMFTHASARRAREVDFEVEMADFFDISALWDQQDKVAGTGMALTIAGGMLTSRVMGGFGWLDGALGAIKVMGPQNVRRMIVPGIILSSMSSPSLPLSYTPFPLPSLSSHFLYTPFSTHHIKVIQPINTIYSRPNSRLHRHLPPPHPPPAPLPPPQRRPRGNRLHPPQRLPHCRRGPPRPPPSGQRAARGAAG